MMCPAAMSTSGTIAETNGTRTSCCFPFGPGPARSARDHGQQVLAGQMHYPGYYAHLNAGNRHHAESLKLPVVELVGCPGHIGHGHARGTAGHPARLQPRCGLRPLRTAPTGAIRSNDFPQPPASAARHRRRWSADYRVQIGGQVRRFAPVGTPHRGGHGRARLGPPQPSGLDPAGCGQVLPPTAEQSAPTGRDP